MQLPAELTVAAHLHVDALIEGQTQKIEGLVHITSALARHRHTALWGARRQQARHEPQASRRQLGRRTAGMAVQASK